VTARLSRGDHENGTVAVLVLAAGAVLVLAAGAVLAQPADNAAVARTAHPAVRKPRIVRMSTPG